METKPNPYKIPPKMIVIEAAEEVPVNHRENCLFFFMGAVCAMVLGLTLYESQILEQVRPDRGPASVFLHQSAAPQTGDFNPFENLPSLY